MKKWRTITLGLLALVLAAMPVIVTGCGAPAGPPVPPVETPSPIPIKFVEPEQLQINFATISGPVAGADVVKLVGPGKYFDEITLGPDQVRQLEQNYLIPSLNGISEIDIPMNVETFMDTITFSVESAFLAGTHDVALDFRLSQIDINGDGTAESCGGDSSTLPACILFWLDDERYSVWRMVEAVSADDVTIGEGYFKTFIEGLNGFNTRFAIGYLQLAATPDERRFEYLLHATSDGSRELPVLFGEFVEANYHLITAEIGAGDAVFKEIRITANIDLLAQDGTNNLEATVSSEYVGRYVEGFDFWSGSVTRRIVTTPSSTWERDDQELDICASIITGNDAPDKTLCENVNGFNLRDGNQAFVDAITAADIAIPAEFPATPTF